MKQPSFIKVERAQLEQWLEALEYPGPSWPEARHKAAVALRERLAQPEPVQEPLAWIDQSVIAWLADRKGKTSAHCTTQLSAARSCEQPMPIYTDPPQRQWVGLTDEEREQCWAITSHEAMRNVEAKLKEKNT